MGFFSDLKEDLSQAEEKLNQRKYFFWYLPEKRNDIQNSLKRMHRNDLAEKLAGKVRYLGKT